MLLQFEFFLSCSRLKVIMKFLTISCILFLVFHLGFIRADEKEGIFQE